MLNRKFPVTMATGELGDEGTLQTLQTEGGTFPFWQPPDVSFGWGPHRKSGQFFLQHFSK
jgi:hypothetical protein